MSDSIELHDSRVAVRFAGDDVVLHLCPAYVHHWDRSTAGWRGEGRSQVAEIMVARGSVASPVQEGIFEISDGWIEVGSLVHENMIPVPLEERGSVRGRLDLVDGEPVELRGEGLVVRLVGEPQFVEDLPAEWAPSGGTTD